MNTPSKYQTAIYDWIKSSKRRVLTVEAVAGSGKSTTLLGALKLVSGGGRGVFLAFNKKIVLEFEEKTKAAGVDFPIRNFNAQGNAFLRADPRWSRAKLDERKYFWLARDHFEKTAPLAFGKLASRAARAVDLVMNTLHDLDAGDEAFTRLCLRYEIDPVVVVTDNQGKQHSHTVTSADMKAILARGLDNQGRITFAEQIYLPATGKGGSVQPHAWVLVDEAQDLNPARLRLVERMIGQEGRAIFVGDSFQAIYGFTGADTRSMQTIRTRFQADTLPLSICYRCPPDHIELVKAWPNKLDAKIEAVPGRANGLLEWVSGAEALFTDPDGKPRLLLAPGDLVICRKNAPLVGLFLRLIRAKVPARVEGQGLADRYADLAEEVLEACQAPEWRAAVQRVELLACLEEWQRQKLGALAKRFGLDSWIYDEESKRLADDVQALTALWAFHAERKGEQSAAAFRRTLKDLFDDEDGGQAKVVRLSSIHRAKGLEAQSVFWLGPQEHRIDKDDPEARQQENNLEYVALTRSKHRLVIVGEPDPRALLAGPSKHSTATSVERVLADSEKRQRGLEELLGRLRAAVERDGLGKYARWDAWVPFNVELEAHKAAWMREAVMPDEVSARWKGHEFLPDTYAREVAAPLGVALRPESRPSPARVEALIKAERDYRNQIHLQRLMVGLITDEEAEALMGDTEPTHPAQTAEQAQRGVVAHSARLSATRFDKLGFDHLAQRAMALAQALDQQAQGEGRGHQSRSLADRQGSTSQD